MPCPEETKKVSARAGHCRSSVKKGYRVSNRHTVQTCGASAAEKLPFKVSFSPQQLLVFSDKKSIIESIVQNKKTNRIKEVIF